MSFSKIWICVLCAHLGVLLVVFFCEPSPIKKPTKQKTAVRTITLKQKSKLIKSELSFLDEPIARPPPPLLSSPQISPVPDKVDFPPQTEKPILSKSEVTSTSSAAPKKEKSQKTKTVETPITKQKRPDSAKGQSKEVTQQKSASSKKKSMEIAHPQKEKMLSIMKESLAALEKSSQFSSSLSKGSSKGASRGSAGKIEALGSEQLSSSEAIATYQEELVAYLKHLVQLPEMGEIKLRLTLTCEGSVSNIAILSSSSDKIRLYVEKKIPTLSFPPFSSRLKGEKSHTFPVTLTSF